ncbi:integral membrane protein [Leptolyngbya sp. Heron Island J]|uniref:hypothetical protein n=1 Tax=Leptolyngbya sp. Heron Island J TaxID=1385935 RepID=UPI0003B95F65|nr:hypothetical protein [Leptolyngbya sp. Heron Island J]ESA37456.1 integral membrane protein [Leptolyngbya sp. Heron Island J]
MVAEQHKLLAVYLQEYEKLKDEQAQRIGFRDNLPYVMLALCGTVLAFALGEKTNLYGFLVLPWLSLVLGWTYLVNGQKISAIGRYIRYQLVTKVSNSIDKTNIDIESIFGWEISHRSDVQRKRCKIEQLIIDEIAFVFSGLAALTVFRYLVLEPVVAIRLLCLVEFLLLMAFGIELLLYADLAKRR